MAVVSKNVAMTGSAVQLGTKGTFARWIVFCNAAAAAQAVGDANVSLTQGVPLAATTGSYLFPALGDVSQHYDLGQWYGIGTNGQNMTVIYDAMN